MDQLRPYLLRLPLNEALAVYLSGGIEWSRAYAALLRLFARAAYHGDSELSETLVRPIATVLRQLVRDLLAQALERGEIRADLDLEATARILNALAIAVCDSQLLPHLNNYFQVTDSEMPLERVLRR
jgi:AcrR family transcriptional regulator